MSEPQEETVAFFSEKAAKLFGTLIYADADHTQHEITALDKPSKYLWDDAIIVARGPMTYIKQGRPDPSPRFNDRTRR